MNECTFTDAGDKWVCSVCGFEAQKTEKPPRKKCKSRGLGDTIAKFTKAIGIQPCGGCKERQKRLNELAPYST